MKINQRKINLHSIACKSVKCFNLFQKPSIYAVISITSPSNSILQSVKTAVDSDGGEDPEFENQIFKFNLDSSDLTLEIDLMLQGNILTLSADRLVGKVNVPVIDLLKECGDGSVRHVSYQVVGNDGKANGVMTFSYEIKQKEIKLPASHDNNNYYPMPAKQDCHAPPHQQYEANIVHHQQPSLYPAIELYPPPPPPHQQYLTGGDVYPPPHQQYSFERQPEVECCYPAPPRQELGGFYPQIHAESNYYGDHQMVGHVDRSSPLVPSACFYPNVEQYDGYGYRPESWDRRLW